jgi:hypothetical protein
MTYQPNESLAIKLDLVFFGDGRGDRITRTQALRQLEVPKIHRDKSRTFGL